MVSWILSFHYNNNLASPTSSSSLSDGFQASNIFRIQMFLIAFLNLYLFVIFAPDPQVYKTPENMGKCWSQFPRAQVKVFIEVDFAWTKAQNPNILNLQWHNIEKNRN